MKKLTRRKKSSIFIPLIWDKPTGSGNKPKGSKRDSEGLPDLESMLRGWLEKIGQGFKMPKKEGASRGAPGFSGGVFLGLLALVVYGISGVYLVETAERVVITRFGKFQRVEGPGLHCFLPLIESQYKVNVEQVSTSEHGGLVLTKDGNLVSIGIAVQYKVDTESQAVRSFLFNVANPQRSLGESAESALRYVLGQFTMDEVLTQKRNDVETAIKKQMIEALNEYHSGLLVLEVAMQFATPPTEVSAAFDEVIKARADEERLVNQAQAYEQEEIPKAKAKAERLKSEALAYKKERILLAEGEALRFNLLVPHYLKYPKLMQTRLYLETLERLWSKSRKIVVDTGLGNHVLYLPLDKWATKAASEVTLPSVTLQDVMPAQKEKTP